MQLTSKQKITTLACLSEAIASGAAESELKIHRAQLAKSFGCRLQQVTSVGAYLRIKADRALDASDSNLNLTRDDLIAAHHFWKSGLTFAEIKEQLLERNSALQMEEEKLFDLIQIYDSKLDQSFTVSKDQTIDSNRRRNRTHVQYHEKDTDKEVMPSPLSADVTVKIQQSLLEGVRLNEDSEQEKVRKENLCKMFDCTRMQVASVQSRLSKAANAVISKIGPVENLSTQAVIRIYARLSNGNHKRRKKLGATHRALKKEYGLSAKQLQRIGQLYAAQLRAVFLSCTQSSEKISMIKTGEDVVITSSISASGNAATTITPDVLSDASFGRQSDHSTLDKCANQSNSTPRFEFENDVNLAAALPYENMMIKRVWNDAFGEFIDEHLTSSGLTNAHVIGLMGRKVEPEARLYLERGVPPQNIITIESDPTAYAEAKQNADRLGINCIFGELLDIVPNLSQAFTIVSYDFVGPFSPKYRSILARTRIAQRAVVRTNMQAGREARISQKVLHASELQRAYVRSNGYIRNNTALLEAVRKIPFRLPWQE